MFVLYAMFIDIKTCTESQNCSQGSGIAFLSVFIVPTIYNNSAFAESLRFLYVHISLVILHYGHLVNKIIRI